MKRKWIVLVACMLFPEAILPLQVNAQDLSENKALDEKVKKFLSENSAMA